MGERGQRAEEKRWLKPTILRVLNGSQLLGLESASRIIAVLNPLSYLARLIYIITTFFVEEETKD